MQSIKDILLTSKTPEFSNYLREKEVINLRLKLSKLKLEIILDTKSGQPFEKNIQIDGDYALVITYNGIAGYIVSFNQISENGIIINQIQGVKGGRSSKVSYKINTCINLISYYLEFFRTIIINKGYSIEVIKNAGEIDNYGGSVKKFTNIDGRYLIFANFISGLLKIKS